MKILHRFLSVLLILCLLLGAIPALTGLTARAATTITGLKMTDFLDPYVGDVPRANFFSTTAQVVVTATQWFDNGGNSTFSAFENGKSYFVRFTLAPNSGYAFPSALSGFTELSLTRTSSTNNLLDLGNCKLKDGKLILETVLITAKTPTKITKIAVTGYKQPVAGSSPQTWSDLSVPSGMHFTVNKVGYYNVTDNKTATSFEAGKEYYASITLLAQYGYVFEDKSAGNYESVTINGSSADVDLRFGNTDGSTGKYYKFLTQNFIVKDPWLIDSLELTDYIYPYVGDKPPANFCNYSGQHVGMVSTQWIEYGGSGDFSTFESGKSYYVRFTLMPSGSYHFPSTIGEFKKLTLTRSGGTDNLLDMPFCKIESGKLILETKTSSARTPVSIDSIAVTGYKEPLAGGSPQTWSELSVPSGAHYTVYDVSYNRLSPSASNVTSFAAGSTYYTVITLRAAYGYSFPNQTAEKFSSCTINGGTAFVDGKCGRTEENGKVYRLITVNFVPDALIGEVKVSNLVQPKPGQLPSYPTVSSSAFYTIKEVSWRNKTDGGEAPADDPFAYEKTYYLSILLEPKKDYYFPSDFSYLASVTFNGSTVDVDKSFSYITSEGNLRLFTIDYKMPKMITKAGVYGLKQPKVGEHPDYDYAATSEPYTVKSYYWKNKTDNKNMTSSDVFEAGKVYFLSVLLEPKEGYAFPTTVNELSSVTFNGSTEDVDAPFTRMDGGKLRIFSVDYNVGQAEPITDIAVTGFTDPLPGELPRGVNVSSGAHYTVKSFYWRNTTDSVVMNDSDVFEEGKSYYIAVLLKPRYGYVFPESFSDLSSVTINGGTALVDDIFSQRTSDGNFLLYSNIVEATAKIRDVNVIGLVKPEAGAHPVLPTVAFDARYEIKQCYWYDSTDGWEMNASDVFEEGKTYFLHVYLTAKSGYTFPDSFSDFNSATFDGKSDEVDTEWSSISGSTLHLYSVDYVIPGTITKAELSGLVKPAAGELPMPVTVADDAPYTIDAIRWFNRASGTDMASGEKFAAGGTYYLIVDLKPKSGWKFPAYASYMSAITINGSSADVDLPYCTITPEGLLHILSVDFTVPDDGHTPGDVNGDGKVNNKDAVLLFRCLKGEPVIVVPGALDVDGSGAVDQADVNTLFAYLSGKTVTLY